MEISSYSSPLALGHKHLDGFWEGTVIVSEKIDGSQISFTTDDEYRLSIRSRKAMIDPTDTKGMFAPAVATIVELNTDGYLSPGVIYRAEAVCKPKHNSIVYGRAAKGGLVLFDVDDGGGQSYLSAEEVQAVAKNLSIDYAPTYALFENRVPRLEELEDMLVFESVLGGKIEGIVLKNYGKLGQDHKVLMAKMVRPEFKEMQRHEWKEANPGRGDIMERIIAKYKTDARWMKAVQHLREEGEIEGIPQDIPIIMREIQADIWHEESEDIIDALLNAFRGELQRGFTRGFADWYKGLLAKEMVG
jgi:hypothetical protein